MTTNRLSLSDQIINCTQSFSNWKFHANLIFKQLLVSDPRPNTKILLGNISNILNYQSSNGRNQFYAVYLLARILLQPECPQQVLEILVQTPEVLLPIYKAAQYDSDSSVKFNERGYNFFAKEPSYHEAKAGINFVRLCLELVLYLKKILTQKKVENPIFARPLQEIEELIHRKDIPLAQWFMGPVIDEDTELVYYDFSLEKNRKPSPIRFVDHPNTRIGNKEAPGSKRNIVYEGNQEKTARVYDFRLDEKIGYYPNLNTCELEDDEDDQGRRQSPGIKQQVNRGSTTEQVKRNAQNFLSSKGFDQTPGQRRVTSKQEKEEVLPHLGQRMEEFGLFSFVKKASIPELQSQQYMDDDSGRGSLISRRHTSQYIYRDSQTPKNYQDPFSPAPDYERENEMLNQRLKGLEQEINKMKSQRSMNLQRENEYLRGQIDVLLYQAEGMHNAIQELMSDNQQFIQGQQQPRQQESISYQRSQRAEATKKKEFVKILPDDILDDGEDTSAKTMSTQANYDSSTRTSKGPHQSYGRVNTEDENERYSLTRKSNSQRKIFENVSYERPSLLLN